jgi:hypothetical protein
VEPIKETQKKYCPGKKNSSKKKELLLKSNETKEPTSEVVVREILRNKVTHCKTI